MSDPTTLLTLPVLSSLFAASIAIWWGRFRVKKHFEKFLYLENKKGNTVTPDVIEGARKGIISRTVTASAAGTMALTTTYISFYAIITRVWYSVDTLDFFKRTANIPCQPPQVPKIRG